MADLQVDDLRCAACGNEGVMVPVPQATRHWTWGDGQKFEVRQFRCLACAARETIERDLQRDEKDPPRGVYANRDGLRLVAKPVDDDVRR